MALKRRPKRVVTSKLILVNKIIYPQVVFDSIYPYKGLQHKREGSVKN